MPRAKLPPGTADDIEAAFYEALHTADIERLMACWADDDEIYCVHPGGPRLVGAMAIRLAFEAMFANGSIQAYPEKLHRVSGPGSSVHSVVERIDLLTDDGPRRAYVLATNVFVKTAQGWRMVAHHASPGTAVEPPDVASGPTMLH